MKKLIVLSVVLALVATAAFAVDIGANVFGLVTPIQGQSGKNANGTDASSDITASGSFQRVRISGGGEVNDGVFGGWFRKGVNDSDWGAYAFWKPIDQFKLLIGGNPDGMYGKEGVTGWMLHENPYDAGVAIFGGNVWGGGMTAIKTRDVFYGGFGDNGLHLNITPIDILGINLVFPFFDKATIMVNGAEAKSDVVADVLANFKAQIDLNLDFGNIAITYSGDSKSSGGKIYAYYGGSFGDLGLDVGVSFGFDDSGKNQPIGAGLGLKFATDAFGIKFRAVAAIGGDDEAFNLLAELVPYFSFSDNITAFLGLGVGYAKKGYYYESAPNTWINTGTDDGVIDFYVNPYVRIGEEWGSQFLVGFQLYSKRGLGDRSLIGWALPIAVMVNF